MLIVEVLVREKIGEGIGGCYVVVKLCFQWFVVMHVVCGGRRWLHMLDFSLLCCLPKQEVIIGSEYSF